MSATSPKGSLPYGWIVKTSDRYKDRVYYFNLATGASTWECPELDPPRVSEDSKESVSKPISNLNRSSEEHQGKYRVPYAENVSAKSNKLIKTMESNNLIHSKVPVKTNIPFSPENFMRTLNAKLACSTRDTSGKSSSIPLIAKKSSPISQNLKKSSPIVKKSSPILEKSSPMAKKTSPIPKKTSLIANTPSPVPLKLPLLPLPSYDLMYPCMSSLSSPEQPKTSHSQIAVSNKRKFKDTEQSLSTTDTNPPTAVVTPVVLEKKGSKQGNASIPVISNKTINKRTQWWIKWKMSKKMKKLLRRGIEQPSEIQARLSSGSTYTNKSSPTALKEGLVGADNKGVRINQPSASASSSESYDADSDMLSEMGEPSTLPSVLSDIQNNSCEDIDMLDVSADLTKIDDLAVPPQATDNFCSYYIVIDTNVLIDDLNLIDELKDTPLNGCGPPHIFIPWIVLQELDALKRSSKAAGTVSVAANHAVRYLNKVLKSKHPRFHGQSPQEAEDCAKSYSVNNDDKILECCMSLAQKMPPEKVILITHDKNLVNKALICDIVVHSWESLMEEVVQHDAQVNALSKHKKKKKKKKSKSPPAISKLVTETNKKNMSPQEMCKAEIHTVMSEARQLLKDVLEQFLIKEMNEAYGDPWNEFKIDRKLLKGILEAITKYWRSVFTLHFAEKDRRNFEILKEKVSRPEGFLGDREDCLNTLTAIEDLFCRIKRRWAQLEIPIEKVEDLRLKCNDTFTKQDSVTVASSQVESLELQKMTVEQPTQIESGENLSGSESVTKALNNAWTVINHLCGMFMDFYDISHNFRYERPEIMPEDVEFRKVMMNLYPCVEHLKKLMAGVVSAIKTYNPRSNIFKELYKAVTELVPNLEIQADNPNLPNFTAQTLEEFCRAPENAERVRLGYKQIELFFSKLSQASKAMTTYKSNRHPDRMVLD